MMKSVIYILMSPLTFTYFLLIYYPLLLRKSGEVRANWYVLLQFYFKVFFKFYVKFSPVKLFSTRLNFTTEKIFFSYLGSRIEAVQNNLSINDVINKSSHDFKRIIKNRAINSSEQALREIWSTEDVKLFNLFNSLKFSYKIFEGIDFSNKSILDVGSSVGGASYLAYTFGASEFAVSDIEGQPLNLAYDVLNSVSKNVTKFPIINQFEIPDFKDSYYDVIFCLHVFEHTSIPYELATKLFGCLKQDGIFIYTYYEATVADGINTRAALLARNSVLNMLEKKLSFDTKYSLGNPYFIGRKNS